MSPRPVLKLSEAKHAEQVASGGSARLSTGLVGLDEILYGGLIPQRAYLVRGGPGTGKTILGLHFLSAGAQRGERCLFITLDEPEERVRANAASVDIALRDVAFLDLSPSPEIFARGESYDIFTPAEVDREPTTQKIIERVDLLRPHRVFLEGLTQFRYLTSDAFQFHKQVLSFLRYLVDQGATVLFSSESSPAQPDDSLQFMSDGVVTLASGPGGRTLSVTKLRGSDFRSGSHSMRIGAGGIEIFPRLVPQEHGRAFVAEIIHSGVPDLDEMLHGGVARGMVTLITGPSGVGKTTLGLQFMKEAAGRGERSVVYLFDESQDTLVHRCEALNIPVRAMIDRGTLSIVPIEPLRYSADELARLVRHEVETAGARLVMLDSLSGYQLCIRGDDLVANLHALCQYLKNMGVTCFLINEVEWITGEFRATELGISHLADNILFLHYMETEGELRKAIGVLKKRMGDFQKTMREIELTRFGIRVGQPLSNLQGILTGTPVSQPRRGRRARPEP
jgi:circadian clock protein KaiC